MAQLIVARPSHGAPSMRGRSVHAGAKNDTARANRTSSIWILVARVALALSIIAGVVAMHSFLTPAAQTSTTMASAISEVSAQTEMNAALHHIVSASAIVVPGAAVVASDCAGCVGDMSMAAMLCILALLTVALMLFAPRLMGRWRRRVWLLLHRTLTASARYLAVLLAPPSSA